MFIFHNSNNREIKISLVYLHAFILQCFPNYIYIYIKNCYLGRLICHIRYFWHLHCQFWPRSLSKWNGFPKLLSPFQGPNRFVALLPQWDKTFQNYIKYRMLSCIVRTLLLLKVPQLLVWLQETLMTQFIQSIEFFFTRLLPRLMRLSGNIPSKLSLVSIWHITNGQNDIFIAKYCSGNWYINTRHSGLRHFDSPSNPCAAYWFPCFKLAGLDGATNIQVLLLSVPECRFISNHPLIINYCIQL